MAKNGPKLQTILSVALHISGLENLENLGKQGFFFFFLKTQGKPGKLWGKNWKKWDSGKTQGTFLYDVENFFLELSNWLEINCQILDSYYSSFSETMLLI